MKMASRHIDLNDLGIAGLVHENDIVFFRWPFSKEKIYSMKIIRSDVNQTKFQFNIPQSAEIRLSLSRGQPRSFEESDCNYITS